MAALLLWGMVVAPGGFRQHLWGNRAREATLPSASAQPLQPLVSAHCEPGTRGCRGRTLPALLGPHVCPWLSQDGTTGRGS